MSLEIWLGLAWRTNGLLDALESGLRLRQVNNYGLRDSAQMLFSPPRPGPAPTRQTRNPGGAAAGGAARRRAPSAYKRTAFLLWKLGCSSVGAT